MFTDTKNLAYLTVNSTNTATKQINNQSPDEEKFKLKKMWKPVLRLMCRKSALAKNGKRDNSSTIPNNVNLNNAPQYSHKHKEGATVLDDNCYTAHKLPLAEFWQTQQQQYQILQQQQQQQQEEQSQSQQLELISKASIDKVPLDTCSNCIYGRNCQHTQFHETETMDSTATTHHHPYEENMNYFDTEDGCFVWSDNNNADMDENALREWMWQNSWQFAENTSVC